MTVALESSTKNLYPKMSLKQPLACKLISTVEQDDTLFLLSMNATSMHLCHFDVIWSIEFHYPDNKKANSNTFYHWIIFAFMSTVLSKGATEFLKMQHVNYHNMLRAVPELNVWGGREAHIFHPHHPPKKIVKDPHHE